MGVQGHSRTLGDPTDRGDSSFGRAVRFSAIMEGYGPAVAPERCNGGRRAFLLWHFLVQGHSRTLGDPTDRGDSLFRDYLAAEKACGTARRIRCEGARLLVEPAAVRLLLVRRGGLRASAGAVVMGAWTVLRDLCAAFVVRHGMEWRLRGSLHLLHHVWLLRDHGYAVPQVGDAICHL